MKKKLFASQLRSFQHREDIALNTLTNLSDDDVIDLHNTCSCCPQKILNPKELGLAIELAVDADHFFVISEAIVHGKPSDN